MPESPRTFTQKVTDWVAAKKSKAAEAGDGESDDDAATAEPTEDEAARAASTKEVPKTNFFKYFRFGRMEVRISYVGGWADFNDMKFKVDAINYHKRLFAWDEVRYSPCLVSLFERAFHSLSCVTCVSYSSSPTLKRR